LRFKIALPLATDPYDYKTELALAAGDIVEVPLRRGTELGVVLREATELLDYPEEKVREVLRKIDTLSLSKKQLEFLYKVSDYNMAPLGTVLKMSIGFPEVFKERKAPTRKKLYLDEPKYSPPTLSDDQSAAAATLKARVSQGFSATLLDGITGSGKTEVYFAAAAKALEIHGSQVLIMLPEIALTSQFMEKFEARFGITPIVWHSNITPAARRESFRAIANGTARIVVGTRSSLFLPFARLAMIVLDEEHDASYKQEDIVVYHARDMAVLKAKIEDIPIILASATPSLETMKNVHDGKYSQVLLHKRFGTAQLPDIRLIDLRQSKPAKTSWLSSPLKDEIASTLDRGEQAMLYINRRGYAPLVLCSACGYHLGCPDCSVNFTAHSLDNLRLECHYCGRRERLPKACPECGKEDAWVLCGPGIERIRDEVATAFPNAKITTISSDELTSQTRLSEIIHAIENRKIDIIIGTQIVVKGHHFPSLTLVGVVDGDMSFSGANLRANEATFQLLTQVSGRSGRGDKAGLVLIQPYHPDNPVMQSNAKHDRDGFMKTELAERERAGMPPFKKLAAILLSSSSKEDIERTAALMAAKAPNNIEGLTCFGPIDAPLALIKRQFRKRFLMIAAKNISLQKIIARWLSLAPPPASVRIKIDIDPYNFL
jgi:primosomal protein N' (replication factor Y)